MTAPVPQRHPMAVESLIFAGRCVTHWLRSPTIPVQSLLYPTFLLITYYLLVGKSVMRLAGTDSLYSLVPMCAVAGAMFGSLAASLSLGYERDSGVLTRLWLLPVRRASALAGRLLAEAVRTLIGSLLITAVGVALGLRFKHGWSALIPFVLTPVVIGGVFATAVIAVAVRSAGSIALFWVAVPAISLVFASSGVAAPASTPAWMRPLIEHQPLASAITFMRNLAMGGPLMRPLVQTLVWVGVLSVIFMPLAVRGYKKAAESAR